MRAIDNTGYRVATTALIAPGNGRTHTKDHVEARKTRACIRNDEITLTAVQFVPLSRKYDIADVVSGKRVTRLTMVLPPSPIHPRRLPRYLPTTPSIHFATGLRPPTMLKIRVYKRTWHHYSRRRGAN